MLENSSVEEGTQQDVRLDFLQDFAVKLGSREIDLPPFPDAYSKILSALEDPDLPMARLGRVVMAAPDLSVRILLLANSALMNRANIEVTDINVAVSRLGLSTIRNAVVALATQETFSAPNASSIGKRLDLLRTTSLRAAAYSLQMAKRANMHQFQDNAMLGGLLHNIGALYILSRIEEYPEFMDPELIDAWSPGISFALIENWGFPTELAKSVEESQLLDRQHFGPTDLTDILTVGILLANFSGAEDSETIAWDRTPACAKLGIDAENVVQVIEEYGEEVDSFLSAIS